jgi:hypothetical protein
MTVITEPPLVFQNERRGYPVEVLPSGWKGSMKEVFSDILQQKNFKPEFDGLYDFPKQLYAVQISGAYKLIPSTLKRGELRAINEVRTLTKIVTPRESRTQVHDLYMETLDEKIYPRIEGLEEAQQATIKEARIKTIDAIYDVVERGETPATCSYLKLMSDIMIYEDFLSFLKKTRFSLLLWEYIFARKAQKSDIYSLLTKDKQGILTTSFKETQKNKLAPEYPLLPPIALLEFVVTVIDKTRNKAEGKEILTLGDLGGIRNVLQPRYMPFLNEANLRSIERSMLSDVLRKRELYAKKHNIDWRLSLDPQRQLRKISKDSPVIERIRRLFIAEAELEYSVLDYELEKRWYDHEINYVTLVKMSRDLYTTVFGSLVLR